MWNHHKLFHCVHLAGAYVWQFFIHKTNESMDSHCVPVHPLPPVLPFPLKPDGHVQVKLPGVFIQVAPSTQSSVLMVHSSISVVVKVNTQFTTKYWTQGSRLYVYLTCTSSSTCSAVSSETRWTCTSEATISVHTAGISHTVIRSHGTTLIDVWNYDNSNSRVKINETSFRW